MILIDNNILFYSLINAGLDENRKVREWMKSALANLSVPLVVAPVSLLALIRIGTNPKAMSSPLTVSKASNVVDGFLRNRNISLINTPNKHFEYLCKFMKDNGVVGNDTMDAHLAVLAMSVGAKVATNDKKFLKFKGVQTFNPIK